MSMKSHTTGSTLPTYDDPMDCDPPLDDDDDSIFKLKLVLKCMYESILKCMYPSINLPNPSPYDAIHPPLESQFGGGSPIRPMVITETDRPMLINLSHLALDYFNKGWSASFEFVDLVKCTYRYDFCFNAFAPRRPKEYYITFQANPFITIFQAKVLVDAVDQDKPPVVEECFVKTPM